MYGSRDTKPNGICNKSGHIIQSGMCLTCKRDPEDVREESSSIMTREEALREFFRGEFIGDTVCSRHGESLINKIYDSFESRNK